MNVNPFRPFMTPSGLKMQAQYPGICDLCGQPFAAGNTVKMNRGRDDIKRYRHAPCTGKATA